MNSSRFHNCLLIFFNIARYKVILLYKANFTTFCYRLKTHIYENHTEINVNTMLMKNFCSYYQKNRVPNDNTCVSDNKSKHLK